MVLNFNEFDDSFNTRVRDSYNTSNTANTTNLGIAAENSGNTDNSVNDSGNLAVGIDGSFNSDSHDVASEMSAKIDDSYNDNSDHSTENTVEDSYNDESDHSVNDSFNTLTDNSVQDHSINAGVRSYNTGFGDFTVGGGVGAVGAMGAMGGGGDITIDARSTVVDQSFNGNVMGGGVFGHSENEAVVASGSGSMAAGEDIDVETNVDYSTHMSSLWGDVNVGNHTQITTVSDSYNTETENSVEDDHSVNTEIEDSYNDNSQTWTATHSFNETENSYSSVDTDMDINMIVDSEDATIAGDMHVDMEF